MIKKEFKPRACLSGKDLADLLEGKMVSAYGTEFVYDGLDSGKVQQALEALNKRAPSEASRSTAPRR